MLTISHSGVLGFASLVKEDAKIIYQREREGGWRERGTKQKNMFKKNNFMYIVVFCALYSLFFNVSHLLNF